MDLHFFFFELEPAMKLIFSIDYIPQPEDFKELSPEMYEAMRQKVSPEDLKAMGGQKIFAIMPEDPHVYSRVVSYFDDDLGIVTEREIGIFAKVEKYIDTLCQKSNREFNSMREKLIYMAQILPHEIAEGTPYAIFAHLNNTRKPK